MSRASGVCRSRWSRFTSIPFAVVRVKRSAPSGLARGMMSTLTRSSSADRADTSVSASASAASPPAGSLPCCWPSTRTVGRSLFIPPDPARIKSSRSRPSWEAPSRSIRSRDGATRASSWAKASTSSCEGMSSRPARRPGVPYRTSGSGNRAATAAASETTRDGSNCAAAPAVIAASAASISAWCSRRRFTRRLYQSRSAWWPGPHLRWRRQAACGIHNR